MILNYYNSIYKPELWIATIDDKNKIRKIFRSFYSINDLEKDLNPGIIDLDRSFSGTTYLVKHQKRDAMGVLIVLNSEHLNKDDYCYMMNTVAHESVHAADMTFQYIGQFKEDFDSRNEPYAYLVGWVAGCIGDYLTKYFKENGSEEV